MLELATLGLLQKEPLYGYRLKRQMELFMSGCISVNYGAIYPLLKRLEEKGFIESFLEEDDGHKKRKMYRITDQGRGRWREKMLEYPHESWINGRSRFMIKFFFFSYLEPEKRLKILEHRLIMCEMKLQEKDSEEKELEISINDFYQLEASQKYYTDITTEIDWIKKQILNLKQLV